MPNGQGVPEHGLQEPLLPIQPDRKSALRRLADSWGQSTRGGWMAMCGFLLDPETGSWTDGGEPRAEGAPADCHNHLKFVGWIDMGSCRRVHESLTPLKLGW